MGILLRASQLIDALNERVGKSVYWLILVMVLISAGNAVIRKVFDQSSNAWLELQWYLFSVVFLASAGYVLLHNEHIRIDIVNAHLAKRTRDWIEIWGLILFLLPISAVMLYESWPYFYDSFVRAERSSNAGGLIRWPVKIFMLIGFALLLLQGISELIKRIAILRGDLPDNPAVKAGPH